MRASILLHLMLSTAPIVGQTLDNMDFEVEGGKPSEIHAWGTWGDGFFRVHYTDWSPVYAGDAMLGYRHWEKQNLEDSGIFQDAKDISAGERYAFSTMIYLDVPEFGTLPSSVELRLEAKLEGQIVTVASRAFEPSALPLEEWTLLRLTGTAPCDNLRALLVITPSGNPGGALKFDGIQIEKTITD